VVAVGKGKQARAPGESTPKQTLRGKKKTHPIRGKGRLPILLIFGGEWGAIKRSTAVDKGEKQARKGLDTGGGGVGWASRSRSGINGGNMFIILEPKKAGGLKP